MKDGTAPTTAGKEAEGSADGQVVKNGVTVFLFTSAEPNQGAWYDATVIESKGDFIKISFLSDDSFDGFYEAVKAAAVAKSVT